jgi:dTDP-4-dehydrorhamnose reductase
MADMQPKLALIGALGMLAREVRERAERAGYSVVPYDLPGFDLTNGDQVLAEMERVRPEVIINCAAYTNVDGAETDEALATRVNGLGPGYLAEAAMAVGAVLVQISTDYVFDGCKSSPYLETDPVGPLSAYGRSKLAGEQAILASELERYFIVRTSWLYGPGGKNFVETIMRLAREREELRIVADQVGSPTYTGDLAEAIFRLLEIARDEKAVMKEPLRNNRDEVAVTMGPLRRSCDEVAVTMDPLRRTRDEENVTRHGFFITSSLSRSFGIYHFSNAGQCSWYEFASEIVAQLQGRGVALKVKRVVPIRTEEYPLPAPRPAYSIFYKEKYRLATGAEVPGWQDSLARYLNSKENP